MKSETMSGRMGLAFWVVRLALRMAGFPRGSAVVVYPCPNAPVFCGGGDDGLRVSFVQRVVELARMAGADRVWLPVEEVDLPGNETLAGVPGWMRCAVLNQAVREDGVSMGLEEHLDRVYGGSEGRRAVLSDCMASGALKRLDLAGDNR